MEEIKNNNDTRRFSAGAIIPVSIVDEMKKSYIDYSMSVIVARALPDIRDGLKPSQRRILYAMKQLNLTPTSHYRKSAKIVGDTTGNFHPHGDAAVYQTLVNMAQDFSTRYPLVDGQGNFGSIDGDAPAQQRYTEARTTKYTTYLMRDIDKGTVLYRQNYDATRLEPTVLPGLFPNLICNGAEGIAVGMATKIPPHNLGEIVDALVAMIKEGNKWQKEAMYNKLRLQKEKEEVVPQVLSATPTSYMESYSEKQLSENEYLYPRFETDLTIKDLMQYVKGPDLPTAGIIYNIKDIEHIYSTGKGRFIMRGVAQIEEYKNRYRIVITELPYQTNKAFLLEKIGLLVKNKKLKYISEIRDESNLEGIRIVIELRSAAKPQSILNKLYQYTELQKAYNANMIALVNGEPRTLTLKSILEEYLTHRIVVTIRRFEYELAQARYRAHILEGLKIALDFIDEVIKTIRASKTQEEAKINLIKRFKLTDVQAQAILDMPLRRLAALERQKIEEELLNTQKQIEKINITLSDENKILKVIQDELIEMKEKIGDKRRTKIVKSAIGEFEEEDLIENELTVITLSNKGYIKRVPPTSFRTQKRGGKGTKGATTRDGDFVKYIITAQTHDQILLFTTYGKVFSIKAYEIPEYSKQAKGLPVVNFINLENNENIAAILPYSKEDSKSKYLIMVTQKGMIKKTALDEFSNIRNSGLIAMKLNKDDNLAWVKPSSGEDQIIVTTRYGRSIRFKETDVKPTSRATKGVKAITFKSKDDKIVNMGIITNPESKILTVTENGYGKISSIPQYNLQKRNGKGVFAMKLTEKTGKLVVAKILSKRDKELLIVSQNGIVIRTPIEAIPQQTRYTQGVRIMKLNKGDKVSSFTVI